MPRRPPAPRRPVRAVVLALLAAGSAAAADPQFRPVNPPPRLTLPPPGADTPEVAFWVYSQDGDVGQVGVKVQGVAAKAGPAPPAAAVEPVPDLAPVTPQGRRVRLRADPAALARPGEYTAELLLTGRAGDRPVNLPVTVTLVRDRAAPDFEPLRGAVVRVYRPFPWSPAGGTFTVVLDDLDRLGGAPLTVHGRGATVRDKGGRDTRELADGRLAAAFPGNATTLTAAPGGRAELTLTLADFSRTGDFATGYSFQSPALEKVERVDVTARVSDPGVYPFLVILVGVVGGTAVARLAGRWRPAQELRYRLARVAGELRPYGEDAVTDPDRRVLVEAVRRGARAAEDHLALGNAAAARAAVEQAERDLAQFQAAEVRVRAAREQELAAAAARAAALARRADLGPDRAAALGEAEQLLAAARRQVAASRLDDARGTLQQANGRLDAATPPPAGGAPQAALPAPGLRVVVEGDAAEWTTDAPVAFTADDPQGSDRERYEWRFGDGDGAAGAGAAGRQARHRFPAAGSYKVVVVAGDGPAARTAAAWVAVAPGRTDRELRRLRREMWAGDLVVAGAAALLATLTGFNALYPAEGTFGTPAQYAAAFLWGFGLEAGTRTVADVLKRFGP